MAYLPSWQPAGKSGWLTGHSGRGSLGACNLSLNTISKAKIVWCNRGMNSPRHLRLSLGMTSRLLASHVVSTPLLERKLSLELPTTSLLEAKHVSDLSVLRVIAWEFFPLPKRGTDIIVTISTSMMRVICICRRRIPTSLYSLLLLSEERIMCQLLHKDC